MTATQRAAEPRSETRRPLVDVFETDQDVVLQFELPGIEPDEVEVGVQGDSLKVETNASVDSAEPGEVLLREFGRANFSREFVLSRELDRDNIAASWSNGVLTLKVPKAAAKTHRIKVEAPQEG